MSLIYQRRVECLLESLFVWTYLTSTQLPQVVQSGHTCGQLWYCPHGIAWKIMQHWHVVDMRMHMDLTPRQFICTHIFAGHFFCGHYLTTKNVKIVPPLLKKNKNKNKKHAIRCTDTNTCTHMLTLKHACTRTNTHIHTCMYSSFSLHLHCILVKLHVP